MYTLAKNAIHEAKAGNLNWITPEFTKWMNDTTLSILELNNPDSEMMENAYAILLLSNILYNNTTMEILPLEDSVYDMLVVKYNNLTDGQSPVGAPPVIFDEEAPKFVQEISTNKELPKVFHHYKNKDEYALFYEDIMSPNTPMQGWFGGDNDNLIAKKKQDISHKYPELAGTLDKCKFLN